MADPTPTPTPMEPFTYVVTYTVFAMTPADLDTALADMMQWLNPTGTFNFTVTREQIVDGRWAAHITKTP